MKFSAVYNLTGHQRMNFERGFKNWQNDDIKGGPFGIMRAHVDDVYSEVFDGGHEWLVVEHTGNLLFYLRMLWIKITGVGCMELYPWSIKEYKKKHKGT